MNLFSFILIVLFSLSTVSAKTVVSGKITGFDGQPIPLANVFLGSPDGIRSGQSVQAEDNGAYELLIESRGVWLLHFSGVYHQDYTVALYVSEPKTIHLDIRLATYAYGTDFSEVKVLGNFNSWYPPSAVSMHKQSDGTYTADIRTKVNPILYQLTGVAGGGMAGAQADRFIYEQSHGYAAVLVPKHSRARIIFDPRKLVSSGEPASFTFADADSAESRFAAVYNEVQLWNAAYTDSLVKSVSTRRLGVKPTGFDFGRVLSIIERQLESEPNEVVRQELHPAYFQFLMRGKMADSLNSRALLQDIPPESVVWSLAPEVISSAFDYSRYDKKKRDDYVNEVIDKNPSAETISRLLSNEFMRKLYGGDRERALRYYDIAVNQYGGTAGAKEVAHYHNISAVDTGKTAPDFSVTSIQNSKVTLSEKSFKGKYLLLDFWATWSKPSVEEIKNLQNSYKEFGGKSFAILSVSLDSSRKIIEQFGPFRNEMPWFKAFVDEGFDSKICKDYEVFAVPKPVLIDPHWKVVAVGQDLRGDKLRKTLAKFLGKHK